jgi:tRNA modification GTPase
MLSDPIAAIATPPGRSGVALIRLSGSDIHAVASSVLRPFRIEPFRTARLAEASHPSSGEPLDRVLYVTYRAPHSYTGEDAVEISTHGGLLVPAEVLGATLAAGARLAGPGEFTRRALANGKLDLLQAEAVADLVGATAPAQRRAALGQLDRGLSRRIGELRQHLLDLESLLSYEIDFPDEDAGRVSEERVQGSTAALETQLATLLRTSGEGERLREGALVVIAGRPNTGKSSLFNALLGTERAIVTAMPGTTRDAVEAPVTCDGFPFRLIDTAGLGESEDFVERMGVEVSHRYLRAADLVIFCVEAGRAVTDDERGFVRRLATQVVMVRTKLDLLDGRGECDTGDVAVSAMTGEGLDVLRATLARRAFTTLAARGDVETVVTRERHRAALEEALNEVRAFREARHDGLDAVVAATHLRTAATALEDLVGVVTPDEVLDRVFASFCVGK